MEIEITIRRDFYHSQSCCFFFCHFAKERTRKNNVNTGKITKMKKGKKIERATEHFKGRAMIP